MFFLLLAPQLPLLHPLPPLPLLPHHHLILRSLIIIVVTKKANNTLTAEKMRNTAITTTTKKQYIVLMISNTAAKQRATKTTADTDAETITMRKNEFERGFTDRTAAAFTGDDAIIQMIFLITCRHLLHNLS
jgi:hypothetical protein